MENLLFIIGFAFVWTLFGCVLMLYILHKIGQHAINKGKVSEDEVFDLGDRILRKDE